MADEEGVKLTAYGYPGDATPDWNSEHGIGDRNNQLVAGPDPTSVALTESERLARFGVEGKSTGEVFEYGGRTYRDDDTAPESDRRIDVFSPDHPPDVGGHASLSASRDDYQIHRPRTEAEYEAMYAPDMPDYRAENEAWHQVHDEESPAKPDTRAPLAAFRTDHPEFGAESDESVLDAMHKRIAPEMDIGKFSDLARQPNGLQSIQNEAMSGLSLIQKIKRMVPALADEDNDKLTKEVYDKLVSQKRIDPQLTDFTDFSDRANPKKGVLNAIANQGMQAWKGAGRESSSQTHAFAAEAYEMPETALDLGQEFYNVLDNPYISGTFLSPDAPKVGSTLKTWAQAADDWLIKNGLGQANDYWDGFLNWMHGQAQAQTKQAQVDATRAAQAQGAAGTAGRVVGGAITGTALQASTILVPGAEAKAAIALAGAWEGLSKYGEAIQAGQDNALLAGIEGAGTGAMARYMMHSPAGRLATGFFNWSANSGNDEVQRLINGEPTDWTEFAMKSGVDVLTGILIGKSSEKGVYRAS